MSIYVTRGHSGRWAMVQYPPNDGVQRRFETIETALWWIQDANRKQLIKEAAVQVGLPILALFVVVWMMPGGW